MERDKASNNRAIINSNNKKVSAIYNQSIAKNMFPYNYAHEKLSNAVRILAIGESDVRSRLWPAFLEFFPLRPEDFPPHLQDDFVWIMHELTKRKPGNRSRDLTPWAEEREWLEDGIVQSNLRLMINHTGRKIAIKICDLEYQIRCAREEWQKSLEEMSNQ